jgi:hypothetical protein
MKIIAGIVGALVLAALVVSGSFLALNKVCSLGDSPIVGQQIQKGGEDKHPQRTETGEQGATPQGDKPKPSARFELRKTDTNKVEGRYYAEHAGQEKETWSHKFLCDTKIGEFTLAVFTLLLVLFTGLLWWSTNRLWAVTLRSAKTAERALTELESPIVGLQISQPGFVSIWRGGEKYKIERKWNGLTFNFINYGRTAAILLGLSDKLQVCRAGEAPTLEWPEREKPYPYGVLVGPDKPSADSFRVFDDFFKSDTFEAIERNEVDVFLVGRLRYRDIFGAVFEMGFCSVFNRATSGFMMEGDEKYNYCRKLNSAVPPFRSHRSGFVLLMSSPG